MSKESALTNRKTRLSSLRRAYEMWL